MIRGINHENVANIRYTEEFQFPFMILCAQRDRYFVGFQKKSSVGHQEKESLGCLYTHYSCHTHCTLLPSQPSAGFQAQHLLVWHLVPLHRIYDNSLSQISVFVYCDMLNFTDKSFYVYWECITFPAATVGRSDFLSENLD